MDGTARAVSWALVAVLAVAGCAAGATPAPTVKAAPTAVPGQELLRKDAAGAYLAAEQAFDTYWAQLSARYEGITALASLQAYSNQLADSIHNFNDHLQLIRFPEDAKAAAQDLIAAGAAAEEDLRKGGAAATVAEWNGHVAEADKDLAAGRAAATQLRAKLRLPAES